MAKQKQIINPEKSDQKKALRIPMPKKGFTYPDKTKYNRRKKHKGKDEY